MGALIAGRPPIILWANRIFVHLRSPPMTFWKIMKFRTIILPTYLARAYQLLGFKFAGLENAGQQGKARYDLSL